MGTPVLHIDLEEVQVVEDLEIDIGGSDENCWIRAEFKMHFRNGGEKEFSVVKNRITVEQTMLNRSVLQDTYDAFLHEWRAYKNERIQQNAE